MRLLRADTEALELKDVPEGSKKYAILSHRWLPSCEEVTYKDIESGKSIDCLRLKGGWNKLNWCRQQAVKDGLQYFWADTACIDKSSSQELTESINAMYRWYKDAEVCYVYLHDMPDPLPALVRTSYVPETVSDGDKAAEACNKNEAHRTLTRMLLRLSDRQTFQWKL